jgi:hypothetical protein
MTRVREKIPKLDTHGYNCVYEAVLEVMNQHFPEPSLNVHRPFKGFYD